MLKIIQVDPENSCHFSVKKPKNEEKLIFHSKEINLNHSNELRGTGKIAKRCEKKLKGNSMKQNFQNLINRSCQVCWEETIDRKNVKINYSGGKTWLFSCCKCEGVDNWKCASCRWKICNWLVVEYFDIPDNSDFHYSKKVQSKVQMPNAFTFLNFLHDRCPRLAHTKNCA